MPILESSYFSWQKKLRAFEAAEFYKYGFYLKEGRDTDLTANPCRKPIAFDLKSQIRWAICFKGSTKQKQLP